MRSSKGLGMLMALAGMGVMSEGQRLSSAAERVVPNKSGSKIKKHRRAMPLDYPENCSAQQRGFTAAGSARLHFQHTNSFSSAPYQPGYVKHRHSIRIS